MKRDDNLFIVSSLNCPIYNIASLEMVHHWTVISGSFRAKPTLRCIRGDYFEMQHFALCNDFSHWGLTCVHISLLVDINASKCFLSPCTPASSIAEGEEFLRLTNVELCALAPFG